MGITSTFFGRGICLAQGHNTATRVGLEPPTSGSGVRRVNHQATAHPSIVVIKPDFGLSENKGADQLCGCENKGAELLCAFVF